MFLSDIIGISLKCDIDLYIELVPRDEPISKASYHMTTQELSELCL